MKRVLRHPLALALVLLFAAAVGAVWLSAVAGRVSVGERLDRLRALDVPVTAEELERRYFDVSFPPEENAAPVFAAAFEALDVERNELRDLAFGAARERDVGEPLFPEEQKDAVAALLGRNAEALRLFREASEYAYCRFPIAFEDVPTAELRHLVRLRDGLSLLRLSAGWKAQGRDLAGAADDIAAIFAIADFLVAEPWMTSHYYHIAAQSIGLSALERVLSVTPFPPDQKERFDEVLRRAEKVDMRPALEGEVVVLNTAFENPWEQWGGDGAPLGVFTGIYLVSGLYYRDWNFALETLERLIAADDIVEQIRIAEAASDFSAYFTEFRVFSGMMLLGFEWVLQSRTNMNVLLRMGRIGLAIERYRADHGRLPESLPELVPAYLDELPREPDGGEFRIERADGWFVVVSSFTQRRDNEDIPLTFRLPLER